MDFTKGEIEKYKPLIISKYLADKTPSFEHKSEKNDLIFDFNDPFMKRWDSLIIILALWSSIIVPFKVAFEPTIN